MHAHKGDLLGVHSHRDGIVRMLVNIGLTYASDQRYGQKCAEMFDQIFGR